jgi:C4-type Zn-finger protein
MAEGRECPMCGATMRLKRAESTVQIPGNPKPTKRTVTEWVCPDCEYFEEADEERS